MVSDCESHGREVNKTYFITAMVDCSDCGKATWIYRQPAVYKGYDGKFHNYFPLTLACCDHCSVVFNNIGEPCSTCEIDQSEEVTQEFKTLERSVSDEYSRLHQSVT